MTARIFVMMVITAVLALPSVPQIVLKSGAVPLDIAWQRQKEFQKETIVQLVPAILLFFVVVDIMVPRVAVLVLRLAQEAVVQAVIALLSLLQLQSILILDFHVRNLFPRRPHAHRMWASAPGIAAVFSYLRQILARTFLQSCKPSVQNIKI